MPERLNTEEEATIENGFIELTSAHVNTVALELSSIVIAEDDTGSNDYIATADEYAETNATNETPWEGRRGDPPIQTKQYSWYFDTIESTPEQEQDSVVHAIQTGEDILHGSPKNAVKTL